MSQVVSISTRKVYGLSRVCRIWRRCRSSVYWHRAQNNEAKEPRRRGPQGPCSDVELIQKIREVLQQSPFHGEGYRKVWAKLRYKGIRTSRRRVLRLMRQEGLLAFQKLGNPRGSKAHEGTILKEEPDQMWGTDMTSTWTGQGQACLFVAVDHCTCECIGIHASRSGNRWQALEPLRQGVRCYLGGFAAAVAPGLEIRHDHGSAYLVGRFSIRDRLLGYGEFASLCPGTGRQRLCRTLHPHPQGEPPVDPLLRHHRRVAGGPAGVSRPLQPGVDH